ncbi:Hypothetical predicted protein, partial [Pelobates cultripes]
MADAFQPCARQKEVRTRNQSVPSPQTASAPTDCLQDKPAGSTVQPAALAAK